MEHLRPSIAAPAASPTVVVPTVVPFGLSRTAAGIVLTGSVPDEATRSALVAAVKAAAPGVTVTDQLTVAAGTAGAGLPTAATLGALVAALPDGAAAAYQNGTITLTGQVASEAAKAAAGAAAAAAFPSAKVANGLTVSAPVVAAECAGLPAALADSQKANPFYFAVNVTTSVSYTHLRAHETVLDLVCRLLLEKKKHYEHNHNHEIPKRTPDYKPD